MEVKYQLLPTTSDFDIVKSFSYKSLSFYLILLASFGCVEPFEPPALESGVSILAVDGTLNTDGISTIRLTRSENLADVTAIPVEKGAKVSFEDDNGKSYTLTEEGNGVYTLPAQNFDLTKQYRVVIRTIAAKEYASEFVPIIKNVPIDSVSWVITSNNGVQVYVSTHDFENNTRYFRWAFDESWKYLAAYNSNYEWQGRTPALRKQNLYQCYQNKPSGKIVIGSTTGLSQNIISMRPIQYIEQHDERIRLKYSILVKQYGVTKEAYDYWLQLQQNTESLGTLFDPQPSQLTGNIKCSSDLSEPVLGFFSAGTTSEKRIFISSDYLPRVRKYVTSFDNCSADTLQVKNIPGMGNLSNVYLLDPLPSGPGTPTAYSYSSAACADCRSAGGTIAPPPFWQ